MAPIEVAPLLAEKYQTLTAAIFTSATLSVRGGDCCFFIDRLGLVKRLFDGDILQIPPKEIDYRQAFLGLTNYLTYRPVRQTMESFKQEMSDELCLFFEFTGGRGLTLFTARDRLAYGAERCEPRLSRLSIPLYWQRPGVSRAALTEEFREQETSVLFGLKSFWEGVDVPGQSLSFVVMEKLPFPFLGDPLFKARREKVRESGQHEFDDYIFPLMAIQFKQGFGRLLRKQDDRGAVLLMDRRIHTKSYRLDLLDSLPGYTRVPEAESSRKHLYQAIANHLPDLLKDRDDFLATLPDTLLTDVVQKIEAYQLPTRMSDAEYESYRESHILPAIREVMGYVGFRTDEQEQLVRAILTGRDVVGLLPTGAGKSFCFQFPALLRRGTTIVFSPLIALMRDQVESLRRRGLEIVDCIYSGQRAEDREEGFFAQPLEKVYSKLKDCDKIFTEKKSGVAGAKRKYSERGIRQMLRRYAYAAELQHPISPHQLRHFFLLWLKKQGVDDALIQPYSGHASRHSLEVYSRLAIAEAQAQYNQVIGRFPI